MAGVVGYVLSPCSDWILPFMLSSSLPCCSAPSRIVLFFFCLVCGGMMQCEMGRAVCVMNGGCDVVGPCSSFPSFPLFRLCVLCHSIVGLGLCLCDRVVSLWNGGNGLCWVGGRVVSTVHTSCVWCASQWCVYCDGGV